jgi:hypothetical protein
MKNIFTNSILLLSLLFFRIDFVSANPDPTKKKGVISNNSKRTTKSKSPKYSGAKYIVSTQEKKPLLYTKSFSKTGKNVFKTTYNIYNLQKVQIYKVIATHNKKNKSIEVTVKDLDASGFPIVNIERTHYDIPFTGRFGTIGKVGAIGKGKSHTQSPGQLTVSFVSKKFDFIKVVHVADAHEDTNKDLQVFVLDE